MTATIPPLPSGPFGRTQFQVWWQQVAQSLESNFEDISLALASMDDLPTETIYANYAGVADEGQLPRVVKAYRYQGTDDVSEQADWSLSVASGSVTATVNTIGSIEITAISSSSATINVSSIYAGVTKTRKLTVLRSSSAAPSTGSGGGTSASDSTFSSISSASMTAISDELTVTAGAFGQVDLSAPLTATVTTGTGTNEVYGIWKWWNGTSYVDVSTEVASDPDPSRVSDGEGGIPPHFITISGTLNVSSSKGGLTPSSSHKFQLYARNASGTRVTNFSGTATAVGS